MSSPEWAATFWSVGEMFFEASQTQTVCPYGSMIMNHF
jgi:hypothetical protein